MRGKLAEHRVPLLSDSWQAARVDDGDWRHHWERRDFQIAGSAASEYEGGPGEPGQAFSPAPRAVEQSSGDVFRPSSVCLSLVLPHTESKCEDRVF